MSTSTPSQDVCQGLLFDVPAAKPKGTKFRKRKIENLFSQLQSIHEQLNTYLYNNPTERPSVYDDVSAFPILKPFLSHLDHEEFWVLNLDTRNRVQQITRLCVGTANMSNVRVGEVFRQAIINNSTNILIAHNHPSGDPTPSPEDVHLTRAIIEAGKLLDISVLDHIVIGACHRYVSLRKRNLAF